MGIEEICSQRVISPFPTIFSTQSDNFIPIFHIFDIMSFYAFELQEPKIGISGKGLTQTTPSVLFNFFAGTPVKILQNQTQNYENSQEPAF